MSFLCYWLFTKNSSTLKNLQFLKKINQFIDQSLGCHCYHHRFYSVSGSRCDGDGCSIAAGAALLRHLEPQQEACSFYIFPEGKQFV